jgi:diguanylate cyclase (GGDEF)-like protein/PAS domain S-box-containing protein
MGIKTMPSNARLSDFIRNELEPILNNWEEFAETLLNAKGMSKKALRDHAENMLRVIAEDIDTPQTDAQGDAKSKGQGPKRPKETWAEIHGGERQASGFTVMETVSEFRALRASVVAQWGRAHLDAPGQQTKDLTRFHEAIDQAVAESLEQYAVKKEMQTQLVKAILVASPDPIFVLDRDGSFIYANDATSKIFALACKAFIGKTIFDLNLPFAPELHRNLEAVVVDQSPYRGRIHHTFASNQGERFEYVLAPVLNEDQNPEVAVCILRDITKQALAEEQAWHSAHHDQLTGLPNRRLFLDRLEQELKHAKRNNQPLSVLFLDLDGFKEVNDSFGHEAGDRLLSVAADRITSCVREDDTVARLGGDEFTVILSGAEKRKDVEQIANTIIEALAQPFDIAQQAVRISASIGTTFYPEDASSPTALLEAADHAMYKAKKSGANQMCFYGRPH